MMKQVRMIKNNQSIMGAVYAAILLMMFSGAVYAACLNPAGDEGDQIYNLNHHVMQYCNGTDWTAMVGNAASATCVPVCPAGVRLLSTGSGWECEVIITTTADVIASLVDNFNTYFRTDSGHESSFNNRVDSRTSAIGRNSTVTTDVVFDYSSITLPPHTKHTVLWMGSSGNSSATTTPRISGGTETGTTTILNQNGGGESDWQLKVYTGLSSANTNIGITHGGVGNKAHRNTVGALPGEWAVVTTSSTTITVKPQEILLVKGFVGVDSPSSAYNFDSVFSGDGLTTIFSFNTNWYGNIAVGVFVNNGAGNLSINLAKGGNHSALYGITLELVGGL